MGVQGAKNRFQDLRTLRLKQVLDQFIFPFRMVAIGVVQKLQKGERFTTWYILRGFPHRAGPITKLAGSVHCSLLGKIMAMGSVGAGERSLLFDIVVQFLLMFAYWRVLTGCRNAAGESNTTG